MKKTVELFLLFGKYSIKGLLQQPLSIILLVTGKIIRFGMFFFFLYYIVSHTKILGTYTLNQTIVFFLTFNFISTLTELLFREVYRFKPLVISGELDAVLVKPYHPFLRILTGGIDLMDMLMLIPYSILLTYFVSTLSPSLINLSLFIVFIINAFIISTSFHILVLSLGVITVEVDNTINIYRELIRLTLVPVDIYKEPIKSVITFVIPVGIMMTIPAKVLMGLVSVPMMLLSIIISISILSTSLFIWNFALRKYQSAN